MIKVLCVLLVLLGTHRSPGLAADFKCLSPIPLSSVPYVEDCGTALLLSGRIEIGDAARFETYLTENRGLYSLTLRSEGGTSSKP
jgi:hypothetical protein